jgi:hypothetical protein
MTPEKCSVHYCRKPIHVIHLGEPLCEKHWTEMCDNDHEAHKVHLDKVVFGSGDSEETRKALVKIVEELKLE